VIYLKLIQWSYSRKYQVKAIFDEFPDMIIVFRTIGTYYFIFTTEGHVPDPYPSHKDYEEMELLMNEEMKTLPSYVSRKSSNLKRTSY
jgi:hypothetical protein